MRLLETILLIATTLRLVWGLFNPAPVWLQRATFALVVLLALQLTLEGYRWQLVPLYLLILTLAILALWGLRADVPHWPRPVVVPITALWLLVSVALPVALPVPHLPEPTGPYPIGTFSAALTDANRTMQYGPEPQAPRRIMVQVWYPAAEVPSNTRPAPWLDHIDLLGPAIARWLGLPGFALNHVRLTRTHAYPQAPLAAENAPFPVLLFSHGWGGFRAQNTFQMEELASHGYIVIAFDHTYGAVGVVFPDGEVAFNDPNALPGDERDALLVQQWAQDMRYALSLLTDTAPDSPLATLQPYADLERVGALGHSTGGGAVILFCQMEPRCKAALGMDPYLSPLPLSNLEAGFDAPYMAMFSQAWPSEKNDRLFVDLRAHHPARLYEIRLQGTAHYDFTDLPAASPLAPYIGLKGPLNGQRVQHIVRTYSTAFFDNTLKGVPSPLLDGPSDQYPEVQWRP